MHLIQRSETLQVIPCILPANVVEKHKSRPSNTQDRASKAVLRGLQNKDIMEKP